MDPKKSQMLNLIEDFKMGSNLHEIRLLSSARVSGTFPLPSEIQNTPILAGKMTKGPFNDTILNNNYSMIKKKRKSADDSSNFDSFNESPMTIASPWEIKQMKGELINKNSEIIVLERRIEQLHNLRKEIEILFDQEKATLKQTIEKDKSTIEKLEGKLKQMRKRELKLKEDLDTQLAVGSQEKHSTEKKNLELTEENLILKEKIAKLAEENSEMTRELSGCRVEIENLKKEIMLSSEQCTQLSSQLADMKALLRQSDKEKALLTIAQQKIAELENEAKNHQETVALVKSQQAKLLRCSELERQLTQFKTENVKLREASSKVIFLEEVNQELKGRLSTFEERDKELRAVKVELGVAVNHLTEYKAISQMFLGDEGTHSQLTKFIKELQQAHLLSHSNTTSLQARLKTLEEENRKSVAANSALREEIAKLKSKIEDHLCSIHRLKKQHAFVTWERDGLRKVMDSMQKETTMIGIDPKVEALEKLVDGYRKRVDQMEKDPSTYGQVGGTSSFFTKHSTELEALKKEKTELLQKIEKLEYELEHRHLKGDFDTRGTKILHLKMNPTAEMISKREDELETCQAEVVMLREKVKLLKEGQQANVTLCAAERVDHIATKELEELREKVKNQELKHKRLVDAFHEASRDFRGTVNALFGYNVSTGQNQVYTLTSLYAESSSQTLLFQSTKNGGLEMLETDFSKSLSELIEIHLNQHHSFPMFLAAVTHDLFSRQSHSTFIA